MVTSPSRRMVLGGLGAGLIGPAAWADDIIDLGWDDLLPIGQSAPSEKDVDHSGQGPTPAQRIDVAMRTDWNGQIVRIPGFVIPMEFGPDGVTAFILVPFVGACIHVPPPPPNQLIYVTTYKPYKSNGLYEAVEVTGMFGTAAMSTQIAEIGYALSADDIRPYRG